MSEVDNMKIYIAIKMKICLFTSYRPTLKFLQAVASLLFETERLTYIDAYEPPLSDFSVAGVKTKLQSHTINNSPCRLA